MPSAPKKISVNGTSYQQIEQDPQFNDASYAVNVLHEVVHRSPTPLPQSAMILAEIAVDALEALRDIYRGDADEAAEYLKNTVPAQIDRLEKALKTE